MPNDNRITEVRSIQREAGQEQRLFTFKVTQLIWLVFGMLEALIAFRIGLKLIAANPGSLIVAMTYGFTDLFLFPFKGMTYTPTYGRMVLEISSVIAMIVYALIAWAIERIIWVVFYRPRGPVEAITQTTTNDQHTPNP